MKDPQPWFALTFFALAYLGFMACIYTMHDSTSVKWGAFAMVNMVMMVALFLREDL